MSYQEREFRRTALCVWCVNLCTHHDPLHTAVTRTKCFVTTVSLRKLELPGTKMVASLFSKPGTLNMFQTQGRVHLCLSTRGPRVINEQNAVNLWRFIKMLKLLLTYYYNRRTSSSLALYSPVCAVASVFGFVMFFDIRQDPLGVISPSEGLHLYRATRSRKIKAKHPYLKRNSNPRSRVRAVRAHDPNDAATGLADSRITYQTVFFNESSH